MIIEESPNRDIQGPLGLRDGNYVRFTGVDDGGDRGEPDKKQTEQSYR